MSSTGSESKADIIKKYRINDKDSGSPEVQIALITSRLENLSTHFQKHGNDVHSQRGMHALISRRKSLLQYLKDENIERYRATLSGLGLRK